MKLSRRYSRLSLSPCRPNKKVNYCELSGKLVDGVVNSNFNCSAFDAAFNARWSQFRPLTGDTNQAMDSIEKLTSSQFYAV